MISEKTVFILGAGASVPYGYPTGFQLNEELKELLVNFPPSPAHCSAEQSKVFKFFEELGCSPKELKKFEKSLFGAARYSIDKFLEKRNDFLDLGKILITYLLKKKEQRHFLFLNLNSENWYAELFNRLDTTVDNIETHQISFITFNYDRSLEFFIYNVLKERTTKSQDIIVSAFNSIPIVHVYGCLGNLPWSKDGGIEYSYEFEPEDIKKMASGINIMSEERETEELKKAHELLRDAKNIYFLGFGYDELNLDRLEITKYGINKKMRGTSYGLSEKDLKAVRYSIAVTPETRKKDARQQTGCSINFYQNDLTIMQVFKKYMVFK